MDALDLKFNLNDVERLTKMRAIVDLAKDATALWFEESSIMRKAKFAVVMDELYKATHEAR